MEFRIVVHGPYTPNNDSQLANEPAHAPGQMEDEALDPGLCSALSLSHALTL